MKQAIRRDPNLREISKKNRRFVLLDSSFIISCVRNKIDFFEEFYLMGIEVLIPKQVLAELERLSKGKGMLANEASLSLKIISKNKFKKIDLKQNYVDKGIKNYAKINKTTIIATLDKELQKLPNSKIIIRGKKQLEFRE